MRMGGKPSFKQWCEKRKRQDLLDEFSGRGSPEDYYYDSPLWTNWTCPHGHEYSALIVSRTLFDRGCPKCKRENEVLPIGTEYGCLTIIGYQVQINFDYTELHEKELAYFRERLEKESLSPAEVDALNSLIQRCEAEIQYPPSKIEYTCQCKCGRIKHLVPVTFLDQRHRNCGDYCKLKHRALSKAYTKHDRNT